MVEDGQVKACGWPVMGNELSVCGKPAVARAPTAWELGGESGAAPVPLDLCQEHLEENGRVAQGPDLG